MCQGALRRHPAKCSPFPREGSSTEDAQPFPGAALGYPSTAHGSPAKDLPNKVLGTIHCCCCWMAPVGFAARPGLWGVINHSAHLHTQCTALMAPSYFFSSLSSKAVEGRKERGDRRAIKMDFLLVQQFWESKAFVTAHNQKLQSWNLELWDFLKIHICFYLIEIACFDNFFRKNKRNLYIPINIFRIGINFQEKLCFEAAIIAQDPYGLFLNYSFCEVLPPNCTRIMFFIIL